MQSSRRVVKRRIEIDITLADAGGQSQAERLLRWHNIITVRRYRCHSFCAESKNVFKSQLAGSNGTLARSDSAHAVYTGLLRSA